MVNRKSLRDEISDMWNSSGLTKSSAPKKENEVNPESKGMMGFDQSLYDRVMSDPEMVEAGAELAGLMDDGTALSVMRDAGNSAVPYGGKMSWTEALSNGFDKGIGTYNLLKSQKAKSDALRSLGGKKYDLSSVAGLDADPTGI